MSTTVRRLVEKAAKFEGSDAAIAQRLGVDRHRLFQWKSGARSMPDDKLIQLAQLASQDPKDALGKYRWERYQEEKKLPRAAVVALAFAVGALSHVNSGNEPSARGPSVSMHIMSIRRRVAFWLHELCASGQSAVGAL